MRAVVTNWASDSPDAWASILGMVVTPLLDPSTEQMQNIRHAALLDGERGSFSISVLQAKSEDSLPDSLLSWIWSARLRHSIAIDPMRNRVVVSRWDRPAVQLQLPLPATGEQALQLHQRLEQASRPTQPDVVSFVMRLFRAIRDVARQFPPCESIKALNTFLLSAARVRDGELSEQALIKCHTLRQIAELLDQTADEVQQSTAMPSSLLDEQLGILPQYLIEPEQRTGLLLFPNLLFRHSATALYQEAHLELERDPQLSFPGMGTAHGVPDTSPKDVRLTPANLARLLAETAIDNIDQNFQGTQSLTILDPACGSGVFLIEAVRELIDRGFDGILRVVGYDVSPVSVEIARFCLSAFAREVALDSVVLEVKIKKCDALDEEWEKSDLILMNPPFIPIDRMTAEQQSKATAILGDLATGRFDLAMAFVWKAVGALNPTGSMASVLPASVLNSDSAAAWRSGLRDGFDLTLLGRFEGYRFFASSLVEPAFLTLKHKSVSPDLPPSIKVVIARDGFEDKALRAARNEDIASAIADIDLSIFSLPQDAIDKDWRTRRQTSYRLERFLHSAAHPTVNDVFNVRQGVLTGKNDVFVLSEEAIGQLPRGERKYFRPAAGQGTIMDGRLLKSEFVFYPYDPSVTLLPTEVSLREKIPVFYAKWLAPAKPKLKSRRGQKSRWWDLSWRRAWQVPRRPRLYSTYFGLAGSFCYDHSGEFAVVQGYAWLWRDKIAPMQGVDTQKALDGTPLPLAYLAVLNSRVFEGVLSLRTPRMQGGQFNLSKRHVRNTPIPDLAVMSRNSVHLVEELAAAGRTVLAVGASVCAEDLNRLTAAAYGFPESLVSELYEVANAYTR